MGCEGACSHARRSSPTSEPLVEGVGGDGGGLCLRLFEEDRKLVFHFFDVAPGHHFQLDGLVVLGELLLHLDLEILAHLLCKFAEAQLLQPLQIDDAFLLGLGVLGVRPRRLAPRKAGNTLAPVCTAPVRRRLRHAHRTVAILRIVCVFALLFVVEQRNVDLRALFVRRLLKSARFLVWWRSNREVSWRYTIGFLNNGVLQVLRRRHGCRLFELAPLCAHAFALFRPLWHAGLPAGGGAQGRRRAGCRLGGRLLEEHTVLHLHVLDVLLIHQLEQVGLLVGHARRLKLSGVRRLLLPTTGRVHLSLVRLDRVTGGVLQIY